MEKGNGDLFVRDENVISEFLLSDFELGLLDNEVFNEAEENPIRLIVFNRIEFILELNSKLNRN